MNIQQLFLYILLLMMFTACAKPSSSNKKTATITPEQITHLLDKQSFECSSLRGGRCPEGIARVFVLNVNDPTQTELCSGFLTSTNRLVTNHHCLASQRQCEDAFISVFNGDTYEVAKCQTLLAAEDDGKPMEIKSVDYAVIELDRHIRTAESFKLSNANPELGDQITAWVIDHVDLFTARITELECKLSQNNNSLELENCPIISGNSGSPLLNGKDEVVGVIWGATTSDIINETTPLEKRRKLNDQAFATSNKYFKNHIIKK